MPQRSIWRGSLSFGLVNVPVKVVTATRSKEVRFHQLHDADGARVLNKRVCSADGEEVPYEHIVKGYETARDEYVTVTTEELEALDPEKSETIDIQGFADLHEIDPLYFEKPYYLVPEKGAAKAYKLLAEAMRESGRVAIAKVVMRTKEHLVAVRPVGDALTMTVLLYHDEVVKPEELDEVPSDVAVNPKELKMAEQLIEALSGPFQPDAYEDEHRKRVLDYIESKAQGREVVTPPKPHKQETKDLVAALQASIEAAKRKESHA